MTDDARPQDKISWRDPEALISGVVMMVFAAGYVTAYLLPAPAGSEQAIGQMQGAAIAAQAAVVAYWLGSSRGSKRNAERADKAVDALTESKK